MKKSILSACAILLALGAGAAQAQDADTLAPAPDPSAAPAAEQAPVAEAPADEQAPGAEAPADAQAPAAEAPADAQAAHDWEFALSATDKAPGASATVMVDEADQGSSFVIVANGLPEVNALDDETRDVNAYTVWVVPGKDRVAESTLAGTLTLEPDGTSRLEGTTDLDTFGIIVTATPDGAPATIGGVPVLTGIPVPTNAPGEAAGDVAEEAAENADDVADEMAEEDADQAADVAEEVSEGVSEVQEEVQEEAAEAAGDDAAEEAAQPQQR